MSDPPPNFRSLDLRGRVWRKRWAWLAAAGGAIAGLSIPPTDFYPALLVGLAVLCATLDEAPTFYQAFGRATAWATVAGLVGLRFVPEVITRFTDLGAFAGWVSLALLSLAQSSAWGIGTGAGYWLKKKTAAPPELVFAVTVFVATMVPGVFVWTPAGVLSPWPALVQLADVVGERGVSVILAVSAALLARGGRAAYRARSARPMVRPAVGSIALLSGLALFGVWRMRAIDAASAHLPTLNVGLVDQAVGPLERWEKVNHGPILVELRDLTVEAEEKGSELTVWPEAAYPYVLPHESRVAPTGRGLLRDRRMKRPLLVGYITADPPVEIEPGTLERASYNSATLAGVDGSLQRPQDKLELLWFGETVPLGQQLPFLRRMFERSGGLRPGKEAVPLTLERPGSPDVRIAVLNCYEDTLTGVGRRLSVLEPHLLVNVTNDAWFMNTPEAELHHRLAVMRAIELRVDLVRAVNLGVASWIDASGRVRAHFPSDGPRTHLVTPTLRDGRRTVYARWGDAPMLGLLAALGVASYVLKRRRGPSEP